MVASHVGITKHIEQSCTSRMQTFFSIPSKNVNVMRQTRTSIDNSSEHMLNDYWNDERKVLLSKERIRTIRFQLWSLKLPEGYRSVNGRTTQVSNTARLVTIRPKEWPRTSKKQEQADCSVRRRKDQIASSSQKKRKLRRFTRRYRIPQGDLRSSSKTRQVRGLFNAVYSQR